MHDLQAIDFDPELIRRFDRSGPRYTSYPTADRFVEAFAEDDYRRAAALRNLGGVHRPLALYVHLPFCRDVCFYCACNRIVTRDAALAARYLACLEREIDLQSALFRDDPRVAQMHWGGGTPTWFDGVTLAGLFARLADRFEFMPHGEYSIEIDPRTVDAAGIETLRRMGFNRVSFGVQDFDPRVQLAIHRVQSEECTRAAMDAARRSGFKSVNVDLIYGLPRQTPESLDATLAKVITARPDRIAFYNYAHLPARFKPQRRIREADLPSADARLGMLGLAIERFTAAGYRYIGMDHFALPGDELAVAQRQGRLHRNFQGYTTRADADLVGLGVSAIGSIGATYSQNHRALKDYCGALEEGRLPVMRGIELTADDLVRRAVIHGLMCNFTLSMEAVDVAYLIDFERYFAAELAELREAECYGLITVRDGWLNVTPRGRPLVRSICSVFDRCLRHDREARSYSRII